MIKTRIVILALLALAVAGSPLHAQVSGAIFTTSQACVQVNGNIYENKTSVYLSGGSSGFQQLTNGSYYVKVTAPDGTLLGTSVGAANETPFVVVNGAPPSPCLQLWAILIRASNATQGYDTTTNAGGEYKVWVSLVPTFDPSQTKTDNFKVKNSCDPSVEQCEGGPTRVSVIGSKYYDADASGTLTAGDTPLSNWLVTITGAATGSACTIGNGTFGFLMDKNSGPFTITEGLPVGWLATAGIARQGTVVESDITVDPFLNVCLGAGGGLTLGYWSNRNGLARLVNSDFAALTALYLRNGNGSDRDFTGTLAQNTSALNTWLLGASATNMAYMLSAQLAAMKLNVLKGGVSGSAIAQAGVRPQACVNTNLATRVTALGFYTIANLLLDADEALQLYNNTVAASDARSCQEYLKNALDRGNNNLNFVQPQACSYSFTCPQ
jgi:hypothetical protein